MKEKTSSEEMTNINDNDRSNNRLEISHDNINRNLNPPINAHELKPKIKNFAKISSPEKERKASEYFVSVFPKNYGISKEDIVILFDKYGRNNSFDEDILEIKRMGDTEGIVKSLRSDSERGINTLDKNDLDKRIEEFGVNSFPEEPMPHCCEYVWEGLGDLMVRLLIAAALFQIIVGSIPALQESENGWVEGMSIILAVIVVVSVGSGVNFTKEKKFRELNEKNNGLVQITVKRNGEIIEIKEEDILVGDIVKLSYGMIIPADGVFISGNEIKCDESPLTGESDLIEKASLEECEVRSEEEIENNKGKKPNGKHIIPSPLVFSGTLVSEGQGWFIALRIGADSEKGKIRAQVEAEQQKKGKVGDNKKEEKKEDVKEGEKKEGGEGAEAEGDEEENNEGKTPLEIKLEDLANDISKFGMISAGATFVALIIRIIFYLAASSVVQEEYERSSWYNSTLLGESPKKQESTDVLHVVVEFIKIIILCTAVIVVAIPEGLPLAVTLTLAFSIGKMMDDNNLVRKMNACETMGNSNFICSDKTGTLTKNEMSISEFFNCNEAINFDKLTSDKTNRESPTKFFIDKYYDVLKLSISLNIEAELNEKDEIVKASKTDVAFVDLLHNFHEQLIKIREIYMPKKELKAELKRFPFTSSRKKMSTIIKHNSFDTGNIIFQKGASEIVLNSCSHFLNPLEGIPELIKVENKQNFEKIIKQFADKALRTICVAYKNISDNEVKNWKDKNKEGANIIETDNFILIGIFGIKDKLRDGVVEAVETCQKAGIKVVMVTGDNIDTAVAIAKECQIINSEIEKAGGTISLTGKEFYEIIGGMVCDSCTKDLKFCTCPRTEAAREILIEKMKKKDPKFNEEIPLRAERIVKMNVFKVVQKNLKVIARSRPEDKYTMVYGLKKMGNIVAVTGDGTNDAPALSKSNVGFAMGISGTDIAKQAADIIILNDNFATIIQAVKWGRNIYDNIRKFIQFQLTVNICACLLVFISSCVGNEAAIGPIQMLWLNLIMDSLGSLALATEPPHKRLLTRNPYPKKEYVINSLMWKHIVGQAIVELAIMVILYLVAQSFIPESNPLQIEVAEKLKNCYGVIPGQEYNTIQTSTLIIGGPALFWPSKIQRLPDAMPLKCGEFFYKKNLEEAHKLFLAKYGSVHLTIVFNSFVMYTLLNQINVRVIDGSYNIFKDIHKNFMFLVLLLCEILLQFIIVQATGVVFKVSVTGLDGLQWLICILIGLLTLLVSVILKPIPIEKLIDKLKKKEEVKVEESTSKEEEDIKEDIKKYLSDKQKQIEIKQIDKLKKKEEVKVEESASKEEEDIKTYRSDNPSDPRKLLIESISSVYKHRQIETSPIKPNNKLEIETSANVIFYYKFNL